MPPEDFENFFAHPNQGFLAVLSVQGNFKSTKGMDKDKDLKKLVLFGCKSHSLPHAAPSCELPGCVCKITLSHLGEDYPFPIKILAEKELKSYQRSQDCF